MKTIDGQYVLVVGCGTLGAHLASRLSREGHSVVAIDVAEEKFSRLAVEFSGFRLEGDATEPAVLRQAKAGMAGCLIAVTGDDNVNLAVAQMGKRVFGIPRVFALVSNPERGDVFRALGVHTVSPLALAADELLSHAFGGDAEEQAG
jgi:trk system potassium uptake protein TrkA